jgi:DNA-binding NtrC family response regulator
MLTGYGSAKVSIQALQLGAFDYITKPFKNIELSMCVDKAVESRNYSNEQDALKKLIAIQKDVGMIYKSEKMKDLMDLADRVAKSEVEIILIEGPTGSGKEVMAKYLHSRSSRADGPFIEINCGALPENLLESELFGHEKGAFTDARERKRGLFEIASGGTVFLDEIGEMALNLQVKLLRVVENKSFMRVGGVKKITSHVRVIAATNKNLQEEVKKKNFRNDLYYRLKVLSFFMPPLAERKEDISPLMEYYIQFYNKMFRKNVKSVSKEAMDVFLEYNWPGNVRELRNVVERIILLEEEEVIALRHIPLEMLTLPKADRDELVLPGRNAEFETLEELEKNHIRKALSRFDNNKTRSAAALGISRKTLWDKINKYRLEECKTI